MKKHWFSILIALSLVFLVHRFLADGELAIPVMRHPGYLLLSVALLLSAFTVLALRWKLILKHMRMRVSFREAVVSTGLPIFAKYVPGKVMMILGKAGYLSRERGYTIKRLSFAAFIDQLLAIITGFIFGALFLFGRFPALTAIIPGLAILAVPVFILFNPPAFRTAARVIGRITGKEFKAERPDPRMILSLLPLHLLYWLLAGSGFLMLTASICPSLDSLLPAAAFPLAVSAGIAAVFAPGGLGVREGVLLAALSASGVEEPSASGIVIAARLWFLTGELCIFIAALLLRNIPDKEHKDD